MFLVKFLHLFEDFGWSIDGVIFLLLHRENKQWPFTTLIRFCISGRSQISDGSYNRESYNDLLILEMSIYN